MWRDKKLARTAWTAVRRRWSSGIPDDILAVVYRMVASLRDRVRFATVCRSWRAAARGAPPTAALPWLLLEPCDCSRRKRLHCTEDGAMVRLRLPRDSKRLIGCHDGGWSSQPRRSESSTSSPAPRWHPREAGGSSLRAKLCSPSLPPRMIVSSPPWTSTVVSRFVGLTVRTACGRDKDVNPAGHLRTSRFAMASCMASQSTTGRSSNLT
ncbi:hypothetical protein ZWY2020_019067 [Hordeum vulgare]|nr:hypothetical protein ZWY2020_019067 [Hordeum vulgare]